MSRLSNPTGIRINRTPYLHITSATVRDARLSYRALGLLAYLLDQKEGWQVRSDQLSKGEGREGRGAIRTALRELAAHGYYRLERRRLRDGKCVMGTAVSEFPVEQWVQDYEIFSTQKDPAVPVVEQADGTFLVEYPDGTLGPDGFEPNPYNEEPSADSEKEPATKEEPPAAPPKPATHARQPRKTVALKGAEAAVKKAAAEEKAAQEKALDEAADEVAKWWWDVAERKLGKYVGQKGAFVAVRKMIRRALAAGYTQRECAKALQEAGKHFPSAQQWQHALGVVTNHIQPKQTNGRVPYSDAATWGSQPTTAKIIATADDATFGVITRP